MSKQRKTREEKIAAREKHKSLSFTYSLSSMPFQTHPIARNESGVYNYVLSDLKKTMTISIILVILQIALSYLLLHRVVTIPGVSY